jgi:hypothetical protein
MSYQAIFGDGEVYSTMVTIGLISIAYLSPYICYGIRKLARNFKASE